MTPGRPFIERPPESDLCYCPACASHYWRELGHACPQDDPLGPARGIAIASVIAGVFWLLVAGGVVTWRVWP